MSIEEKMEADARSIYVGNVCMRPLTGVGGALSLGDYLAIHGTATVTNARLVHIGLEAEASWWPLFPGPEKEEAECM